MIESVRQHTTSNIALGGVNPQQARTKEEAARQFEEILARQLVASMTQGLFKNSLAGDQAPGWVSSQQDTQRDMLTDTLADHLVDSGALRLSDLLLRKWNTGSEAPTSHE